MMDYEKIGEIRVAKILRDFIGDEVLPGTDVGAGQFGAGLRGWSVSSRRVFSTNCDFATNCRIRSMNIIALPRAGRSTRRAMGSFFARSVILARSRPILPFAPKMSWRSRACAGLFTGYSSVANFRIPV